MLFIFSHDFSRLLRGARSVPLHYCSATVIINLFRVPAFAFYCSQHWWGVRHGEHASPWACLRGSLARYSTAFANSAVLKRAPVYLTAFVLYCIEAGVSCAIVIHCVDVTASTSCAVSSFCHCVSPS